MKNDSDNLDTHQESQGTIKTYFVGFFLSLALTLTAYFLVSHTILAVKPLVIVILFLALVQTWIQLRYFLHLGQEPSPYWNLLSFLFMVAVVLILVIGTLWIMYNLNYRMMPHH